LHGSIVLLLLLLEKKTVCHSLIWGCTQAAQGGKLVWQQISTRCEEVCGALFS
jgi:hypothetical protein